MVVKSSVRGMTTDEEKDDGHILAGQIKVVPLLLKFPSSEVLYSLTQADLAGHQLLEGGLEEGFEGGFALLFGGDFVVCCCQYMCDFLLLVLRWKRQEEVLDVLKADVSPSDFLLLSVDLIQTTFSE